MELGRSAYHVFSLASTRMEHLEYSALNRPGRLQSGWDRLSARPPIRYKNVTRGNCKNRAECAEEALIYVGKQLTVSVM